MTNLAIGFLAEPAIATLYNASPGDTAHTGPANQWHSYNARLSVGNCCDDDIWRAGAKNLAIARPYKTAALVQLPLLFFTNVMRWPIRLLNNSANVLLHRFGVEPTGRVSIGPLG